MRFLGDWAEARPAATIGTTATNPPLAELTERYVSKWREHPAACWHVDPEGGTVAFMLPWHDPLAVLCAHCTFRATSALPTDDPESRTCDDCREVSEDGLYQVMVQSGAVVLFLYLCERCFDRIDTGGVEEEIPAG